MEGNIAQISPIFIIGAARNGTTNLENTIASISEIVGAEHWLHFGSHESNICQHKKYWGDLTDVDDYISFLYKYSSYDYFQLCQGDIHYHLTNHQNNFYSFFFDLMDHFCQKENKKFWITKLDPHFFLDPKERQFFFSLLRKRYSSVKFIRIKRNFKNSFLSYLKMEGKNYNQRSRVINLVPAFLLQTSRYALTYSKINEIEKTELLDVNFEEYIKERKKMLINICDFLNIGDININSLNIDRFQINTSFLKKDKEDIPQAINIILTKFLSFLTKFPLIARFVWHLYEKTRTKSIPDYRRLVKYKYFRDNLVDELKRNKARGLISTLHKDNDI